MNRNLMLIAICSVALLVNLDLTGIGIALPTLQKFFHIDLEKSKWVIQIYTLLMTSFLIAGGKISDWISPKRVFIFGNLLFLVSSIIASTAFYYEQLLFGRALQGIAVALLFPTSLALIYRLYPQDEQAKAIGLFMAVVSLSQGFAPFLCGMLLHYFGWQFIFAINIPINCIVIAISQTNKMTIEKHDAPNYRELLFFIVFSSITIAAFSSTENYQYKLFGISVMLTFLVLNHYYGYFRLFMIPRDCILLLRNKVFPKITLYRILIQYNFFTYIFSIPYLLHEVFHFSTLKTSAILLTMTLNFSLISLISGRIKNHHWQNIILKLSFFFIITGNLFFCMLVFKQNNILLFAALSFVGIGIGLALPSTLVIAMRHIAPNLKGFATGLFFTFAMFGGAAGITVACLLLETASLIQFSKVMLTGASLMIIAFLIDIVTQKITKMFYLKTAH